MTTVLPQDLFPVFGSLGYMRCLYWSREEHHKVFCFNSKVETVCLQHGFLLSHETKHGLHSSL